MAELTGLLTAGTLTDYPAGTRVLIRRERPHPGAELDALEERDGWRYQCIATDTALGQLAFSTPATAPTPASRTASAPARTTA